MLRSLSFAVLALAGATTLQAQAALRASPSGRATTEVTLSVPRPAGTPMAGMAGMGMTPATGAAAAPAAAATPAPKPLSIRVDYGQPHLRGRTLHTDSLVPYDKPWRLGANASTTLTTDVDLSIGGATVPKGAYVLYAIPRRDSWSLVIQRNVGQSAMQYADSNDVARIELRRTSLAAPVESLTMWLIPAGGAGPAAGELRFAWGTQQLSTSWAVK